MLKLMRNAFISEEKALNDELATILSCFKDVDQWLDLIKSLKKLKKFLDKSQENNICLDKNISLIAECLNICLQPQLPAGIQLKSLDLYMRLMADLPQEIYLQHFYDFSIGIFPVMAFASELVFESLWNLYNSCIIPYTVHLKSSLNGLILSLLPGLAEPHSSQFEKTIKLIDTIWKNSSHECFLQSIWSLFCLDSMRMNILNYINRTLERENNEQLNLFIPLLTNVFVKGLIKGIGDTDKEISNATLRLIKNSKLHECLLSLADLKLIIFSLLSKLKDEKEPDIVIKNILIDLICYQDLKNLFIFSSYIFEKYFRESFKLKENDNEMLLLTWKFLITNVNISKESFFGGILWESLGYFKQVSGLVLINPKEVYCIKRTIMWNEIIRMVRCNFDVNLDASKLKFFLEEVVDYQITLKNGNEETFMIEMSNLTNLLISKIIKLMDYQNSEIFQILIKVFEADLTNKIKIEDTLISDFIVFMSKVAQTEENNYNIIQKSLNIFRIIYSDYCPNKSISRKLRNLYYSNVFITNFKNNSEAKFNHMLIETLFGLFTPENFVNTEIDTIFKYLWNLIFKSSTTENFELIECITSSGWNEKLKSSLLDKFQKEGNMVSYQKILHIESKLLQYKQDNTCTEEMIIISEIILNQIISNITCKDDFQRSLTLEWISISDNFELILKRIISKIEKNIIFDGKIFIKIENIDIVALEFQMLSVLTLNIKISNLSVLRKIPIPSKEINNLVNSKNIPHDNNYFRKLLNLATFCLEKNDNCDSLSQNIYKFLRNCIKLLFQYDESDTLEQNALAEIFPTIFDELRKALFNNNSETQLQYTAIIFYSLYLCSQHTPNKFFDYSEIIMDTLQVAIKTTTCYSSKDYKREKEFGPLFELMKTGIIDRNFFTPLSPKDFENCSYRRFAEIFSKNEIGKISPTLKLWTLLTEAFVSCGCLKNEDYKSIINILCEEILKNESYLDVCVLLDCLSRISKLMLRISNVFSVDSDIFIGYGFPKIRKNVKNNADDLKKIITLKLPNILFVFSHVQNLLKSNKENLLAIKTKKIFNTIDEIVLDYPLKLIEVFVIAWQNIKYFKRSKINKEIDKNNRLENLKSNYCEGICQNLIILLKDIQLSNPSFVIHNFVSLINIKSEMNVFALMDFINTFVSICNVDKLYFAWSSLKTLFTTPENSFTTTNQLILYLWKLNILFTFFGKCKIDFDNSIHKFSIQTNMKIILDFLLTQSLDKKNLITLEIEEMFIPPLLNLNTNAGKTSTKIHHQKDLSSIAKISLQFLINSLDFIMNDILADAEEIRETANLIYQKLSFHIQSNSYDEKLLYKKYLSLQILLTLPKDILVNFLKDELLKHFENSHFFQTSLTCLTLLKSIYSNLVDSVLLCKFMKFPSTVFMNSLQYKRNCLEKLSFVIFCSKQNQFYKFGSKIVGKLLEYKDSTPELAKSVYMCLRIFMFRTTFEHSEDVLLVVLKDCLRTLKNSNDITVLVSVLKFCDLYFSLYCKKTIWIHSMLFGDCFDEKNSDMIIKPIFHSTYNRIKTKVQNNTNEEENLICVNELNGYEFKGHKGEIKEISRPFLSEMRRYDFESFEILHSCLGKQGYGEELSMKEFGKIEKSIYKEFLFGIGYADL